MTPFTFFIAFAILASLYVLLGYICSQHTKNTSDYFLAGRGLGLIPVAFTLIATQLGGGMLLGTSQEAYVTGFYGLLYTLGITVGFLLLASGFAARLQSLNVETTAQLFETRYGSIGLRKFASILSMITLFGLLIAQIVASKTVITAIGIENPFIFITFWLFIIFYTMVGGLKAVVVADFFQVCFIIVVFGAIFLYSAWSEPIGTFGVGSLLKLQSQFALATIDPRSLIATLMMPALFALIEQDLAQRFFAARSQRVATFAALGASLFIISFALIPIYLGMKAKLMGLAILSGASPLVTYVAQTTHEYVLLLALCGVVAAITSTADSLLCAISSNLAQDFDFSVAGIKNKLLRSKVITLGIGLAALVSSYAVPSEIITILINSYALSVCCLLVPLLFAYFNPRLPKKAAIGGVVGGLAVFLALIIYNPFFVPKELIALGISLLGFGIGAAIK